MRKQKSWRNFCDSTYFEIAVSVYDNESKDADKKRHPGPPGLKLGRDADVIPIKV